MNDVMKKRLIGLLVLLVIGISIPVLLSRCTGGDSGDQGQMRVYDVQSNGQTAPADKTGQGGGTQGQSGSAGQSSGGQSGSKSAASGQSNVAMPDAVSPQSSDQGSSASSKNGGFSTPPVHGDQGNESSSGASSSKKSTASNRSTAGSTHENRSAAPKPQHSASSSTSSSSTNSGSRSSRSSSSGHDYGARTQGGGASTNRSQGSTSGASSSGKERTSISGWVVQIASFSKRDNAEALAGRLAGDYSASYTPAQVNGKTWYRVNVGPFNSESAARSAAARLKNQGHHALVRDLP